MKPSEITLDWLQSRVIERDGCWIWTGSCSGGSRNPQAKIGGVVVKVRRVVWEAFKKERIPFNHDIRCECDGICIHPNHLICSKKGAAMKGRPLLAIHKINIAKGKRENSGYSDEVIDFVKLSEESHAEVSKVTGISESYVRAIRGNLWRKDYTNPFAGLIA